MEKGLLGTLKSRVTCVLLQWLLLRFLCPSFDISESFLGGVTAGDRLFNPGDRLLVCVVRRKGNNHLAGAFVWLGVLVALLGKKSELLRWGS